MPNLQCGHCNATIQSEHRFCPSCGRSARPQPRPSIVAVVGITVVLFGLGYSGQSLLAGKAPTLSHSEHAMQSYSDPTIERLRAAVKTEPTNIGHLHGLAEALGQKLAEAENPPSQLIFEMIQTLGQVLKVDPMDRQALISMANVSFNQRAFDKAAEFYQRYLALVPDDSEARANHASSLAFLGQHDRALSELESILAKEPTNFQATAFKAVTYASMGDAAQARAIGEKALLLAPTAEARERLADFLARLEAPAAGTASAAKAPATTAPKTTSAASIELLAARLKAHPIAGPKFVRVNEVGDSLQLLFQDFPMGSMPPFMRDKFLETVRGYATEAGLARLTLRFIDEKTGTVMAEGKP